MEFQVNTNQVILAQINQVESGEYNVTECRFNFSSEYEGLTKKAVFTGEDGTAYLQTIVDNKCSIPSEILAISQVVQIGVYAYAVENEELILRYSPEPTDFFIHEGSYKDAQNSTPPTPSEIEQLQAQITHNRNDIDELQQTTEQHGETIQTINENITIINESLGTINENIGDLQEEQVEQNRNIQANADNIEEIQQEQITQNTNIQKNTDDIVEINQNINEIDGHINAINEDIDNLEQDLTNYSLITETGSQINLNVNSTNYKITAVLKDKNGNVIYTSNAIDLPIESMIVNARYDNATKEIVLTLQNGNTLRISVADLISGLVSETQLETILANYYTKMEVDNLLSEKANQTSLDTTNQNLTNLAGRVSINEEDIADIKEEQTTQNTNIEELQNQVETLQEDLESANSEIEELNTDIINMRKAMLQVEGEGTDITLQNTSKNKFVEFGLEGRTEQEQLTGKNLFSGDYSQFNSTGGEGTLYDYFKLPENDKVYTISVIAKNDFTPTSTTYLGFTGNGGNASSSIKWVIAGPSIPAITKGTKISINNIANEKKLTYISMYSKGATNLKTFTDNFDIQLEEGSTTTSYEPYCGGIPSPNPDYPQQIKNVTGNSNVKIQNKNLFDENYYNNTSLYNNQSVYFAFVKMPDIFKTKFYGNMSLKGTTQNLVFGFSDSNISISTRMLNGGNIINNIEYDFRNAENVYLIIGNSNKINIQRDIPLIFDNYNIMISKGIATSYVPHQEQNYPFTFAEGQRGMQGTTLEDDGIHNSRVHVIINGTENWQVHSNKEHCFKLQLKYTSASGLCTHYQNIGATYLDIKNGIYLTFTNVIIISDLRFSNVEDFKSWLVQQYNNGTPLEVEYVIRGDEEKKPYNATQQVQYNNIKANASSYDDITIISSESDELGFDMKAIAVADANKVINSLDTRLLALEGNTNQSKSLNVSTDTKNITKETTDAESEVK